MSDQQFGLMSGDEIRNQRLVARGIHSQYRASTYDLTVGEIVVADQMGGTLLHGLNVQ